MRRTRLLVILVAAAMLFPGETATDAAPQEAARVDVTGKWVLQVTTSAGSGEPTVTFKLMGETLTGHYSSTNLGEADLTGTVKGRDIQFRFVGTVQGMSVNVAYSGTIESTDTMMGTLDIGGLAQGRFTGKRQ